jgi:hypothetical protein
MFAGKPPALGASAAAPRDGGAPQAARGAGGAPAERWSKPIPDATRPRPEQGGARNWREEERELAPGESRLLSRPAGPPAGPPLRGGPQQGWKDPAGFPPPPPPPGRFAGKDDFRGAPQRTWDAQGAPGKPEVRAAARAKHSRARANPAP